MKRAPCAGRAVERDVAAHRSREPARDGKAESGAAFALRERARSARRCAAGRRLRCPALRRRPSPRRVPAVLREGQADRRRRGRMADRIADEVDEDLDDRPLLAIGRQRLVAFELDRDVALLGRDSSITTASAASAARSIAALALARVARSSRGRPTAGAGRRRRCRCRSSHNRCAAGRRRARRCARRFR